MTTYREIELALAPLALWGLGEASGTPLLDAIGANHGTYAGTIAYGAAALPSNNTDGAVNFLGTGSGTVPHSAAFTLSAYTLSFWFTPNHVPREGDPALPLVNKSAASSVPGDFSCFLASNDGDVLRVRLRDAANNVIDISTPNDTIQAGQRYHVCIRGDSTGVTLHLDGKFIGKATTHTIGWSSINTQPLQFAHGLNFAATGDCILDEICLFNRVVSGSEIAALAQRTGAPIAVAGGATVLESTTTEIDVLINDSYVGIPTIEIMANPGAPDSVAVVAAANTLPYVNYTAGAVGAGGATRSFRYRITDVNGTSNTVACPVTVQDTGFVPTSIANCYTRTTGAPASVSSMTALRDAINAAGAGGAQITIAANTYVGDTLTFNPQGTEAGPIVVRPAGARGSVIINDALWTIQTGSSRLVIENIHFNNAQININGSHHRIARCQFRDIGRYCIIVFAASDTRISHCDFTGYRFSTAIQKGCVQFDGRTMNNNGIQRALIDYCHIHDIRQDVDVDPSNPLQIGTAGGSWRRKLGIIVDHCLINNVKRHGSGEFIVCKTSEVTLRYCTFTNMGPGPVQNPPPNRPDAKYSQQYLQQHQGSGIEVRSCWLGVPLYVWDDMNVPARRPPLIIGNHMTGAFDIHCRAGNDGRGQGGAFSPGPYHRCTDGRYIGNTLEQGHIIVGDNPSVPNPTGPPDFSAAENNNVCDAPAAPLVRRNIRQAGGEPYSTTTNGNTERNHSGTTFNDDTAADNDGNSPPTFTVPTGPLTVGSGAGQVGMTAPDPLCPSGPQN